MSELDRIIDAWAQTTQACLDLGADLTGADWHRPTECPEWTVKDIYAHLVGGEVWMSQGHPAPPQGLASIADEPVRARRDTPGPVVLEELRDVLALRLGQLRANPPDPDAPTQTAFLLPVTTAVLYQTRAFDVWVHEQDLRRALGRPGGLDTPAAKISRSILLNALPRVVAKLAGAPPGASVRLTVTGPIAFDRAIVVDADGRARLSEPPAGDATLTLCMDWETFARLTAGRILPPADLDITGDAALATRVLTHIAVTP